MAVSAIQSEANNATLRALDGPSWSIAAAKCREWGFRQSVAYSERLAAIRGASSRFLEVRSGRAIVGYANVRIKSAPVPGAGMAYVSGGPLLACDPDGDDAERCLRCCLGALAAEFVGRRRLTLRIAPTAASDARSARVETVAAAMGFELSRTAPRYRTILVDVSKDDDSMRAAMAQKWRNQLNSALRQETQVTFQRDPSAIERFAPLFQDTQQRKGFSTDLDPEFYHAVQQAAAGHDRMVVAVATHAGSDVAGAVMDIRGETATYVLGATTEAGMKCKAAYALHWRTMLVAREAGCRWYDLGGIDPDANPGVYHFKSGFGGIEATAPGPFDLRPGGFAGKVGELSEGLYRRMRAWRDRAKRMAQRRPAGGSEAGPVAPGATS